MIFTCGLCGGKFHGLLTKEQALEQLAREFPDTDPEKDKLSVCCDDCYQRCFGGRDAVIH